MMDLQTFKTVLDERFRERFLLPRVINNYLLGTGLAVLAVLATILLVGHYESQHCEDGKSVLTEKDARACERWRADMPKLR